MSKLPDKKSKLIRLAIADLEKCEADPKYEIDMAVWLLPLPNDRKLYHEDPERFKKNMLKIADWYEEIGE